MTSLNTSILIKDDFILDLIDSIILIHAEKDIFKQFIRISPRKCYREYSYEIYIDTIDKLKEFNYYNPVKHDNLFSTVTYQVYTYLNDRDLWV